jgi:hypothetical protein
MAHDESKCSGQSWGHWFWTLNFEGKQSHLLTLKTGETPLRSTWQFSCTAGLTEGRVHGLQKYNGFWLLRISSLKFVRVGLIQIPGAF